jgi:hypothetical protein
LPTTLLYKPLKETVIEMEANVRGKFGLQDETANSRNDNQLNK